jgi:YD repeat-containing protein
MEVSVDAAESDDQLGSGGFDTFNGTHAQVYAYGVFPRKSYFQQGSSVVYPYVTEYVGTSDIAETTMEYKYTDFMDEDAHTTMRGEPAELPYHSYVWKCGKLWNKTIKDKAGTTIYRLLNEYQEINRKDVLNLRVLPYHILYGLNAQYLIDVLKKEGMGAPDEITADLGGSLYDYYNYYLTTGEYKVSKSSETIDGNTKTTTYTYNGLGQVTDEKVVNSDGSELLTKNKYTFDLMNENPSNMLYHDMYWDANINSPVLDRSVYRNGTLIDQVTQAYADHGTFFAPQSIKQLGYYEPRIKYLSYDSFGNPTGVSKDDLEQTYYLWGYQGTRLLAEMKGASFTTLLGKTLVDRVTSAVTPATADLQAIEALRTNATIPNARLTTLSYDAQRRLSSVIAPTGMKITYVYDSFGRLVNIKDQNGQIVEGYQYDYKQ